MGLTIATIGLIIWPDLPRMQSLNHTIKIHPRVKVTHTQWCQLIHPQFAPP